MDPGSDPTYSISARLPDTNSSDLLADLAEVQKTEDLAFLTLELKSLPTSIQHHHGLDALNELLAARSHPKRRDSVSHPD